VFFEVVEFMICATHST